MKRVILVRTLGPRNAGLALRAVANFGPAELVLVAPARPSLLVHPEFEQMSHGVERVRERIRVAGALAEALADCTHSIAFTARPRDRKRLDWRDARDQALAWARPPANRVALVFGSEENGLEGEETDLCQLVCYLPTAAEHTSINLAMSVGLVLSSLLEGPGRHARERGPRMADHASLAYLRAHLKQILAGRVARSPSARQDIEDSIERVFSRTPIESRDARAWNMMMRALGSQLTPPDLGIEKQPRDSRRKAARERRTPSKPPGG